MAPGANKDFKKEPKGPDTIGAFSIVGYDFFIGELHYLQLLPQVLRTNKCKFNQASPFLHRTSRLVISVLAAA